MYNPLCIFYHPSLEAGKMHIDHWSKRSFTAALIGFRLQVLKKLKKYIFTKMKMRNFTATKQFVWVDGLDIAIIRLSKLVTKLLNYICGHILLFKLFGLFGLIVL
jgi:hypothetical protein